MTDKPTYDELLTALIETRNVCAAVFQKSVEQNIYIGRLSSPEYIGFGKRTDDILRRAGVKIGEDNRSTEIISRDETGKTVYTPEVSDGQED